MNRLREILTENKIEDLVISSRFEHRLNTAIVDCDYFDILDGKAEAISRYHGEYLLEYEWAEETNAYLNNLALKSKREGFSYNSDTKKGGIYD